MEEHDWKGEKSTRVSEKGHKGRRMEEEEDGEGGNELEGGGLELMKRMRICK